jgi:hypothetical protein
MVDRHWGRPQGRWGVFDPRSNYFVFTTDSLLEARSWMEHTQDETSELTVVWIPEGGEG